MPDTATMLDLIGVAPGRIWLDLGCGSPACSLRVSAAPGRAGHGIHEVCSGAGLGPHARLSAAPWPLLPGRFAERGVDAVLPAGSVRLEEIQHVAVDPQGDRLFGVWNGGLLRWRVERLCGHRLECLLRRAARVGRSSRSIGAHDRTIACRRPRGNDGRLRRASRSTFLFRRARAAAAVLAAATVDARAPLALALPVLRRAGVDSAAPIRAAASVGLVPSLALAHQHLPGGPAADRLSEPP